MNKYTLSFLVLIFFSCENDKKTELDVNPIDNVIGVLNASAYPLNYQKPNNKTISYGRSANLPTYVEVEMSD